MCEENRLCGFGFGLENKQEPEFNTSREEIVLKVRNSFLKGKQKRVLCGQTKPIRCKSYTPLTTAKCTTILVVNVDLVLSTILK